MENPPIQLGFLVGVPLVIEAELGRRTITLADLLRWEIGSVIRLPKKTGGPIDVYASGSSIARGEVTFSHGGRGIRITEVEDA